MQDPDFLAWVVGAIMVLTVLEVLFLFWRYQRSSKGPRPSEIGLNIASGLCLMAALLVSLIQSAVWPALIFLAAAGFLHGIDLWRRWQR